MNTKKISFIGVVEALTVFSALIAFFIPFIVSNVMNIFVSKLYATPTYILWYLTTGVFDFSVNPLHNFISLLIYLSTFILSIALIVVVVKKNKPKSVLFNIIPFVLLNILNLYALHYAFQVTCSGFNLNEIWITTYSESLDGFYGLFQASYVCGFIFGFFSLIFSYIFFIYSFKLANAKQEVKKAVPTSSTSATASTSQTSSSVLASTFVKPELQVAVSETKNVETPKTMPNKEVSYDDENYSTDAIPKIDDNPDLLDGDVMLVEPIRNDKAEPKKSEPKKENAPKKPSKPEEKPKNKVAPTKKEKEKTSVKKETSKPTVKKENKVSSAPKKKENPPKKPSKPEEKPVKKPDTYHVYYFKINQKWCVRSNNLDKRLGTFRTKQDAMTFAQSLVSKKGGSIVEHKKDE